MTIQDIYIFFIPVLIAIAIWHQHKLNRVALAYALGYCQKQNMQLLDQSVALKRIRVTKSADNLPAFERCYRFEFSLRGDRRYNGWVTLVGQKLTSIKTDPIHEHSFTPLN